MPNSGLSLKELQERSDAECFELMNGFRRWVVSEHSRIQIEMLEYERIERERAPLAEALAKTDPSSPTVSFHRAVCAELVGARNNLKIFESYLLSATHCEGATFMDMTNPYGLLLWEWYTQP